MKTNKIKLLLSCGALVVLGAASLQGCSSSDDSSSSTGGTGGSSTAGSAGKSSTGGTGTAGKTSTGGTTGTAGTGTAGTGTAGTGTAGTSAGGTSAGGTSGSEGGEPGAAGAGAGDVVDCTTFCADEEATCTFGAATAAPYASSAACMTACMGFTPGDVAHSGLNDPDPVLSGNTFACRRWHLSKAGTAGNSGPHCPHTGLLSKTAYADTTATGPCK